MADTTGDDEAAFAALEEAGAATLYVPAMKECTCCKGYIYGCAGDTCLQLGVCMCSADEEYAGEGAEVENEGGEGVEDEEEPPDVFIHAKEEDDALAALASLANLSFEGLDASSFATMDGEAMTRMLKSLEKQLLEAQGSGGGTGEYTGPGGGAAPLPPGFDAAAYAAMAAYAQQAHAQQAHAAWSQHAQAATFLQQQAAYTSAVAAAAEKAAAAVPKDGASPIVALREGGGGGARRDGGKQSGGGSVRPAPSAASSEREDAIAAAARAAAVAEAKAAAALTLAPVSLRQAVGADTAGGGSATPDEAGGAPKPRPKLALGRLFGAATGVKVKTGAAAGTSSPAKAAAAAEGSGEAEGGAAASPPS